MLLPISGVCSSKLSRKAGYLEILLWFSSVTRVNYRHHRKIYRNCILTHHSQILNSNGSNNLFLDYLTTVCYLDMFYSIVWDVRMNTNHDEISIWKEVVMVFFIMTKEFVWTETVTRKRALCLTNLTSQQEGRIGRVEVWIQSLWIFGIRRS